jgi:hypothetical protein
MVIDKSLPLRSFIRLQGVNMPNTKTWKGIVSDKNIAEEPLRVQRMCWELLDIIQLEYQDAVKANADFEIWKEKADKLPHSEQDAIAAFSATLRWEEITDDDIATERFGDNTKSRPLHAVSGGVH